MSRPRRCIGGCNRILVSEKRWRAIPVAERPRATHGGHHSHGVCRGCMSRIKRAEQPARPRDWRGKALLEDWAAVQGEVAGMTMTQACRVMAPRFGRTPLALERALQRLGVRGPYRRGQNPQGRAA